MQISYRIEHDTKTGDYIAYCPAMKPVSVYGKTQEEAQGKFLDAVKLYLKKHPDAIEKIRTSAIAEV